MSSPARTVALAAGLAVALALATWLVGADAGYVEGGVSIRSSLRTSPDGVAALDRTIARLGRTTAPRMTPFADADPLRGAVFLLEAGDPPSPREAGSLLEWVRQGGTLVYAPPFRPSAGSFGLARASSSSLLDSLGMEVRRAPGDTSARWTSHPLTDGLPSPKPIRHVVVEEDSAGESSGGLPSVRLDTLLATPREDEDDAGVAAALIPLGQGRIVLFASAEPLSNERAGEDPLAHLAVRAALRYTTERDTVFFAEFHHGVHGLGSPLETVSNWLLGAPPGRAALHGTLVVLAALAFAGVRLGAPRDPRPQERRSPLEHATALATLYETAGAGRTAALLLMARPARSAGLPAPRDADDVAALLRTLRRRGGNKMALDRIRRGWTADPPDLAAVAGGIDEYAERTTRS